MVGPGVSAPYPIGVHLEGLMPWQTSSQVRGQANFSEPANRAALMALEALELPGAARGIATPPKGGGGGKIEVRNRELRATAPVNRGKAAPGSFPAWGAQSFLAARAYAWSSSIEGSSKRRILCRAAYSANCVAVRCSASGDRGGTSEKASMIRRLFPIFVFGLAIAGLILARIPPEYISASSSWLEDTL